MRHWKPTVCRQNCLTPFATSRKSVMKFVVQIQRKCRLYYTKSKLTDVFTFKITKASLKSGYGGSSLRYFSVCRQCALSVAATQCYQQILQKKNRLANSGTFKPRFRCTCRTFQLTLGLVVTAICSLSSCLGCCINCRLMYCIELAFIITHKAVPLQTWTGPEGSRRLRLSDFKTIGK